APISGTVTASHINPGSIAAGLAFAVEDTASLRVITRFREYDISRISQGMEVAITSDGTGSTQHIGEITRINPAAVAGSPIVEFEAEITIMSEDTGLRLGMTARVEIELEREAS
ncbi:MAG: HlyD family efflux transporter periplasmic adaptor subunit, partial [Defluviitaleaceae bacterium]|nr:HlyD family efflux transporter periplasmic adaptor subunit [Defluviitaleaceae bacterium]